MKRNITMKKPAVFFLCLLSFCVVASAQFRDGNWRDLDDSEVVRSMKEQVEFLSSAALEGRKAGSEGEKAAAEYISGQLSLCGVDVLSGGEGDIFGIRQENGDTLTSRNVIGFIPGYDPELRDSYILIGARMDNLGTSTVTVDGESREKIFYGANGNASGLSMLLQLAAKLNTNRVLLKRSVLLVAFGASVDLCAGSWYFLNRSFPDVGNIDAMINLDMLGTGSNGFYAYTASNVDLNAVITRLSGTLQPVQPQIVSMEPVNSDHRMFYAKEIPSVFFTTGMYPEYNTDRDTAWTLEYDGMERELEYIYNFTLELVNGPAPDFRETDEFCVPDPLGVCLSAVSRGSCRERNPGPGAREFRAGREGEGYGCPRGQRCARTAGRRGRARDQRVPELEAGKAAGAESQVRGVSIRGFQIGKTIRWSTISRLSKASGRPVGRPTESSRWRLIRHARNFMFSTCFPILRAQGFMWGILSDI